MREAYVVGAGQSEFGSFPDENYRSLFSTAFETGTEETTAPTQVVSTATVEAEDRVDPVVRLIYFQEGVTRYGPRLESA